MRPVGVRAQCAGWTLRLARLPLPSDTTLARPGSVLSDGHGELTVFARVFSALRLSFPGRPARRIGGREIT